MWLVRQNYRDDYVILALPSEGSAVLCGRAADRIFVVQAKSPSLNAGLLPGAFRELPGSRRIVGLIPFRALHQVGTIGDAAAVTEFWA